LEIILLHIFLADRCRVHAGPPNEKQQFRGQSVMMPDPSMIQPTQGAFTRLAEYIVHSGQAGVMVLVAVVMVIAVSVWLALRPQL